VPNLLQVQRVVTLYMAWVWVENKLDEGNLVVEGLEGEVAVVEIVVVEVVVGNRVDGKTAVDFVGKVADIVGGNMEVVFVAGNLVLVKLR